MALSDTEKEKLLRAFYHERLLPLVEKARDRGVEFFPTGPDTRSESYFIERGDDGNYVHEIDAADLAGGLRELWSRGEPAELAELAAPIVALAEAIRETDEAPDDVSPFIYAMF
jgi:hypothetical protein